jgi:hypothetical protein
MTLKKMAENFVKQAAPICSDSSTNRGTASCCMTSLYAAILVPGVIERMGTNGNAPDLYSGDAQLDSRRGHQLH